MGRTSGELNISRVMDIGQDPAYLTLIHRHFEKAKPVGEKRGDGVHYTAPVDLLSLIIPPEDVGEIAEIEMVYAK